jgi:predicted acyl esterase
VDVFPDGKAINLTDDVLRPHYHKSFNDPEFLVPDRVYMLKIDLWAISLEISSSNFPRLGRNMNTGGKTVNERLEGCMPVVNRVFHNHAYPSHLILPIVER